ncbi:site-specific integrase [Olivibacter sp. CPCC 100613]|uniref:site-specific integrase n=1 Tax=Olivibacter sp. CPCC 100613 TaxID=3079931 RepID=UPI002FF90C67
MALITTNFILRTDKKNLKGECPIVLTVSVSGALRKVSTGISILPEQWNYEHKKAFYLNRQAAKSLLPSMNYDLLPSADEIKRMNGSLAAIMEKAQKIASRFDLDGIPFTVQMIIEELSKQGGKTAVKQKPKEHLVDFIDQYIDNVKASRNPGTIKVYITTKNHIKDYETHNKVRVTLADAGYGFLQSFYNYLIEVKKQINVTAAKQVTTAKTFISFARKFGYKINDTYHDFTVKRETLEVIALTEEEFMSLYNLNLSGEGKVIVADKPKLREISFKALAKVRDVFCFSCVTGLRYSDLAQLRREHIKNGYIQLTVTKTKEPIEIPLTAYAVDILNKYSKHIKCLPIISSQKFNDYLKALCKHAGINEKIEIVRYKGSVRDAVIYPKYELVSAHTGRKTFATLSLEKGLNAEEVMSITGHKSYASFKRYVKITHERKKAVMHKAWGAPKPKLKAVGGHNE